MLKNFNFFRLFLFFRVLRLSLRFRTRNKSAEMAANGDEDEFVFPRRWSEEEEDDESLRDRSPLGNSRRVRRMKSTVVDPLTSKIEDLIEGKLEGLFEKVARLVDSSTSKAGEEEQEPTTSFSTKLEELQLTQKDLARQQKANAMVTEGGKYQFLALSKIRSKVESAELVLGSARSNPENFTLGALKSVLGDLKEARDVIDRRMDLVSKADSMPNGFRVLSAFEKRVEDSNANKDPEDQKIWSEVVKQMEKEKKERWTRGAKSKSERFSQRGSYIS